MSTVLKCTHGSVMLHPESCGSAIKWSITIELAPYGKSMDINVWLADCDRQIHWYSNGDGTADIMHDKLTAAIDELTKVRAAIPAMKKFFDKVPNPKEKS